jgi:hypothetical protein
MVLMEIFMIALLLMGVSNVLVMADTSSEPHTADAMWVEPSSVTFTNVNGSVGQKFNVTVWLNMTKDVFNYQVGLHYNRTQLKCLRVFPTARPTSEYMASSPGGTTFVKIIDTSFLGNGTILASEACSAPDYIPGPNSGSLFWAEFQIMVLPTSGNFTSKFDISKEYLPGGAGNTWVHDQLAPAGTDTYWDFSTFDSMYTFVGPPGPSELSVSVSPPSASIFEGQSVFFTSTVNGGIPPYTYQWYVNGTSVSGANSNNWAFTPATNGSYNVYLNVTDNAGTTAASNTATVTVTPKGALVDDVAVLEVVHWILGNSSRSWVYQGMSVSINVTVMNNGGYDESVNVTLYYNITANQKVDSQTINLNLGENTTIAFKWNTLNIPYWYNYTLTAVADINLDATPADNTLTGGDIEVRIPGDIDGSGTVDGSDLGKIVMAFASYGPDFLYPGSPAHPRWNPYSDVNGDGKVDGKDLGETATNFGKHFP